jgi:hypothetical protein
MAIHVKEPKPGGGDPFHWVETGRVFAKTNGNWDESCEIYVKENGVWSQVFNCVQELIIPSAENFNFGSWLRSQNVPVGSNIVATLPAGNTIGGTVNNAWAFHGGDLSIYGDVEVIIQGEIQGKGGDTNHPGGSHAFYSPSKITVTMDGGNLRGGGGAGGKGGKGADGNGVKAWHSPRFQTNDVGKSYWQDNCSGPGGSFPEDSYCRWINHAVGHPCGHDWLWDEDHGAPGKPVMHTQAGDEIGQNRRDNITRATSPSGGTYFYNFTGGAGGNGGKGYGYEGPRTAGSAGGNSVGGVGVGSPYEDENGNDQIRNNAGYAGKGGKGGTGGWWGNAGGTGARGGSGKAFVKGASANLSNRYRATQQTTTNYGQGSTGGAAGWSLWIVGGSVFTGIGLQGKAHINGVVTDH